MQQTVQFPIPSVTHLHKKGKMLAAYANTPDIMRHTGTVCEKFAAVCF